MSKLLSSRREFSRICTACLPKTPQARVIITIAPTCPSRQTSPQNFQQQRRHLAHLQPLYRPSPSSTTPRTPPTTTFYHLFPETLPQGPPPQGSFVIDVRALRREFLRLQAKAHPDAHPAAGRAAAESQSALINEAFRTLADPLLRAQYLLSLHGADPSEDEAARVADMALLTQVMEAREEIDEATDEAQLEAPRRLNEERVRLCEQVLEQAFRQDDLARARDEAVKLKYWVKVRETLRDWERGHGVAGTSE